LIETVRQKTAALLPPKIEYRVIGEANVLQVFEVTKGKTKVSVAGCRVSNGNITRTDKVRVLRGPERTPVFEGESTWRATLTVVRIWSTSLTLGPGSIDTLKHLKKDVPTVRKGTECGISFEGFDDIRADDQITTFSTHEIPREL
jgi:translation initiation factor IF-2